MDALLEVVFNIIIEGSIEYGFDKKVPLLFRILLLLIFVSIYGALIGVLCVVGMNAWKRGNIVYSIIIFVIDVFIGVLVSYLVRKKYIENYKNNNDMK